MSVKKTAKKTAKKATKKTAKKTAKKTSKLSLIEQTKASALERNSKRLAELIALIRRRMAEMVEGFYDIGEALREILDKKLYGADGHASLEALVEATGLMSFRQATKLIALVRKMSREEALALGQEKSYALVAYVDATPEDDNAAELVAANAKIDGKAVKTMSVRELRDAAKAVRAKRPPTEAERARSEAETEMLKGLRAVLREAGITHANVTVAGDEVRVVLKLAQVEKLLGDR